MKPRMSELATFVAALWAIGPGRSELIPDVAGVLDLALQDIQDDLPPLIAGQLHFSETAVGVRCLELPQIVDWMQYAHLIEYDGSTFTKLRIMITEDTARMTMIDLGFMSAQYEPVAQRFYDAVKCRQSERRLCV